MSLGLGGLSVSGIVSTAKSWWEGGEWLGYTEWLCMVLEVCAPERVMTVRRSIVALFEGGMLDRVHNAKVGGSRCAAME